MRDAGMLSSSAAAASGVVQHRGVSKEKRSGSGAVTRYVEVDRDEIAKSKTRQKGAGRRRYRISTEVGKEEDENGGDRCALLARLALGRGGSPKRRRRGPVDAGAEASTSRGRWPSPVNPVIGDGEIGTRARLARSLSLKGTGKMKRSTRRLGDQLLG